LDEIDAAVRKFAELIEIIAAVNDARIDERRGFGWHTGSYPGFGRFVNEPTKRIPTAHEAPPGLVPPRTIEIRFK
jgi:hypothetical protein